ncbi:PAP2 superfamily-domain-containing protein [Fusarium oxysporum II5]|nr:PAP2 superfamily-domain-containing protein [Fusarium oxysporum II5]
MSSYHKMPDIIPTSNMHFSVKLFISYAFDWVVLIIALVVSVVVGNLTPNKRDFSLVNPYISHVAHQRDTISIGLAAILSLVVPAVIIAGVVLVFVPGGTVPNNTPSSLIWRRKIWELHVGLLGLALSFVSVFFFVQCMKNLLGKPRPNMLSRCEPDVSNAMKYLAAGYANSLADGRLYSADICQQRDSAKLNEGFRAFPSGHSSISAAGLVYLTLFLASKLAVNIPFVPPSMKWRHEAFPSRSGEYEPSASSSATDNGRDPEIQSQRRQAAGAPLYLLVLVIVPFALAVYINCSRWFDYQHDGFDIIFAFLMGTVAAYYSFRFYHLPIAGGAGWAWRPRTHDRAFWAGVGKLGYVGDTGENHHAAAAVADRTHSHWSSRDQSNSREYQGDDIELQGAGPKRQGALGRVIGKFAISQQLSSASITKWSPSL